MLFVEGVADATFYEALESVWNHSHPDNMLPNWTLIRADGKRGIAKRVGIAQMLNIPWAALVDGDALSEQKPVGERLRIPSVAASIAKACDETEFQKSFSIIDCESNSKLQVDKAWHELQLFNLFFWKIDGRGVDLEDVFAKHVDAVLPLYKFCHKIKKTFPDDEVRQWAAVRTLAGAGAGGAGAGTAGRFDQLAHVPDPAIDDGEVGVAKPLHSSWASLPFPLVCRAVEVLLAKGELADFIHFITQTNFKVLSLPLLDPTVLTFQPSGKRS